MFACVFPSEGFSVSLSFALHFSSVLSCAFVMISGEN